MARSQAGRFCTHVIYLYLFVKVNFALLCIMNHDLISDK